MFAPNFFERQKPQTEELSASSKYFNKADNIHRWIQQTNSSMIVRPRTTRHEQNSQGEERPPEQHCQKVVPTLTESLPAPMRSQGTRRSKPFLAMIFAEGQEAAADAAAEEANRPYLQSTDELLLADLLSPRHQEDAFIAAQSKKIGDPQRHVEALYLQYEAQFNALVPRVVRVLTAMAEQGVSISAKVLEDQLFKEKLTATALNPHKKANIEALRQQLNNTDKGRNAYSQPGFQIFETLPSQVCFDIAPYVSFLATVGGVSPVSFLGAFVLLDRLFEKYDTLFATHLNTLKLFMTSVRIASKVLEISVTNHKTFSHAARSSTMAMSVMEAEMLVLLDWNVFISPQDLQGYADAFCCSGISHRRQPQQHSLSISGGGYVAVESDSTQRDDYSQVDDTESTAGDGGRALEVSAHTTASVTMESCRGSLGSSRPSFVRRLREIVSIE